MKEAFYERILFRIVEDKNDKTSIIGISSGDIQKIEVLHWGTNRDGSPFPNKSQFAYLNKPVKGINVGDGKWLIDRGHVLGY